MAHDNYHLMMSMALDGALLPQENAQLHDHLEICPICQSMWSRMCLADHLFSEPIEAAPPLDFAVQVMARVTVYEAERRENKPWRLALIIILGQFAIVVGLALAGVALLGDGNIMDGIAHITALGRLVAESLGEAVTLVEILLSALQAWLVYLTDQPLVWAAIISALMLASIWIGLLEVLKPTPAHALVQSST